MGGLSTYLLGVRDGETRPAIRIGGTPMHGGSVTTAPGESDSLSARATLGLTFAPRIGAYETFVDC